MSESQYRTGFPATNAPLVDPKDGFITQPWLRLLMTLWNRTGSGGTTNIVEVIGSADQALIGDPDEAVDEKLNSLLSSVLSDVQEAARTTWFPEDTPCDVMKFDQPSLLALVLGGDDQPLGRDSSRRPYIDGLCYSTWDSVISVSGAIAAVDTLYLYPFFIEEDIGIDQLYFRVNTAGAGSSVKGGIYRDLSGRPEGDPIVVDNTGVSSASTGLKTLSISTAYVTRGWYWAATKSTGTLPRCVSIAGTTLWASSRIGSTSADVLVNGATNQISGLSIVDAYASNLPNLTGAVFTLVTGTDAGIPILAFRAKS